jgi:signal peptidase I
MSKRKPEGKFEFIKTIVIAGALALGFRSLLFEPFNIPSGSMIPTLLVGDYLFVSKYSYGYSRYSFPFGMAPFDGRIFETPPERGDVAVFRQPQNESVAFIKRIVGLPGDRIQVVNGVLRINDVAVNRDRKGFATASDGYNVIRFAVYQETLPNGKSYLIQE